MSEEASYDLHIPRLSEIIHAVCDHYNVNELDILSNRRAREVARPRQVTMWLARKMTLRSLPEIGKYMRRDHTTVMHGVSMIDRIIEEDPWFMEGVHKIRRRIGQRVLIREALEQSLRDAA